MDEIVRVLLTDFVLSIFKAEPDGFGYFLVVVAIHMLLFLKVFFAEWFCILQVIEHGSHCIRRDQMTIETVSVKYSEYLYVAINHHKKVILVDVLVDTLL